MLCSHFKTINRLTRSIGSAVRIYIDLYGVPSFERSIASTSASATAASFLSDRRCNSDCKSAFFRVTVTIDIAFCSSSRACFLLRIVSCSANNALVSAASAAVCFYNNIVLTLDDFELLDILHDIDLLDILDEFDNVSNSFWCVEDIN